MIRRYLIVRISSTIASEYATRCPDHIPEEAFLTGRRSVSVEAARAMLEDAKFNSDTRAVDVGEYGVPLGTFNAYRALAKQLTKLLASEAEGGR